MKSMGFSPGPSAERNNPAAGERPTDSPQSGANRVRFRRNPRSKTAKSAKNPTHPARNRAKTRHDRHATHLESNIYL